MPDNSPTNKQAKASILDMDETQFNKIADAAILVTKNFPTLPADEQGALIIGLVSGKLTFCADCGHVYETSAGRCSVCDDLADAAAAAIVDDEYNRNATHYDRF